MRLAKKGELLTHHKDKAVLTLMKVENVVEKDFIAVHPEMELAELVKGYLRFSPQYISGNG